MEEHHSEYSVIVPDKTYYEKVKSAIQLAVKQFVKYILKLLKAPHIGAMYDYFRAVLGKLFEYLIEFKSAESVDLEISELEQTIKSYIEVSRNYTPDDVLEEPITFNKISEVINDKETLESYNTYLLFYIGYTEYLLKGAEEYKMESENFLQELPSKIDQIKQQIDNIPDGELAENKKR